MDVFSAIKGRRSIRDFQDKFIPEEHIASLIDALLWAPSAGNLQSRRFYFVRDAALKKGLARAALGQGFIALAPLVVVACADERRITGTYGKRGVELYSVQDASTSLMCMMLAAHALGLGSVWVGAFREEDVSAELKLPSGLRPVAIVPVGYPERIPKPPPRVSPAEAVVFK